MNRRLLGVVTFDIRSARLTCSGIVAEPWDYAFELLYQDEDVAPYRAEHTGHADLGCVPELVPVSRRSPLAKLKALTGEGQIMDQAVAPRWRRPSEPPGATWKLRVLPSTVEPAIKLVEVSKGQSRIGLLVAGRLLSESHVPQCQGPTNCSRSAVRQANIRTTDAKIWPVPEGEAKWRPSRY